MNRSMSSMGSIVFAAPPRGQTNFRDSGPAADDRHAGGGTEIFCKDWGTEQPIVFSHGWPLSADDCGHPDVVLPMCAGTGSWHDRRRGPPAGRGRSVTAADMDHSPTTWLPSSRHLDLGDAPCTSATPPAAARWPHSSARKGRGRAAEAALISAVPPIVVEGRRPIGRPAPERSSTICGRGVARIAPSSAGRSRRRPVLAVYNRDGGRTVRGPSSEELGAPGR